MINYLAEAYAIFQQPNQFQHYLARHHPPDHTLPQQQDIQASFNKLSGAQLMKIYSNRTFFIEIISNKQHYSRQIDHFLWRVAYILGEIIFYLQSVIYDHHLIDESLLLSKQDIQQIASRLLTPTQTDIACRFESLYQADSTTIQEALFIYNYAVSIWKDPVEFQILIPHSFSPQQEIKSQIFYSSAQTQTSTETQQYGIQVKLDSISQELIRAQQKGMYSSLLYTKKENIDLSYNTIDSPFYNQSQLLQTAHHSNDISVLPKRNQQYQKQKLSNQLIQNEVELFAHTKRNSKNKPFNSNTQKLSSFIKPSQMQQLDKGTQKWGPQQQKILIESYLSNASNTHCSSVLISKLGENPKWCMRNVKVRIEIIVRKVFKKFMKLDTGNQNIRRFKQNFHFITNKCVFPSKGKIYQSILVIYESMLNMSEDKREKISRKIMDINKICALQKEKLK